MLNNHSCNIAPNDKVLIENIDNSGDSARVLLKRRIMDIENSCPKHIKVPIRLTNPDILVIQTKAHLETLKPYISHGLESNVESHVGFLAVDVTKGNISRMMRFVDSFIKLLNKRGHSVKVSGGRATFVTIDDEWLQIKFREKCKRQKIIGDAWRSTALVPTGQLSVKLMHLYKSIEWVDNRKQLEEQLVSIVASLELHAENEKADKVKWQLARAEQKRLQDIEDRRKAAKVAEQAKVELLLHHAEQWKIAQNLDQFITHIESMQIGDDIRTEVQKWIRWAKGVQDSIDPLACGISNFERSYDIMTRDVQEVGLDEMLGTDSIEFYVKLDSAIKAKPDL